MTRNCFAAWLSWVHRGCPRISKELRWLNGIEPAWAALDYDSYNALREGPSGSNQTIWLDPSLTLADLSGSAVAHAARTLLKHAIDAGGLKLTATGNLSRSLKCAGPSNGPVMTRRVVSH